MTRLPSLRAREVASGLEALGFHKIRQTGSHAMFRHEDGRSAPLPVHPKELSPYFVADILRLLKITEEEFLKAIR